MFSELDHAGDSCLRAYHHSDMEALAVELPSTAALLGLGWVAGVCVCACVCGWYLGHPEASTLAHIYFVPGLAVISF